MFRFLTSAAALSSVLFIATAGQSEPALPKLDVKGFAVIQQAQLSALESCDPATIELRFHDAYLTTHAADYLFEAMTYAELCGHMSATLVQKTVDDQSAEEAAELARQAQEVEAFFKASDASFVMEYETVQTPRNSGYESGHTMKVAFSQD